MQTVCDGAMDALELVLRARVAYEQEMGRKYAGDMQTALGRLVHMTESLETVYRAEKRPSQWYCLHEIDLIVAASARVRAGFAKVEHGNTPLAP